MLMLLVNFKFRKRRDKMTRERMDGREVDDPCMKNANARNRLEIHRTAALGKQDAEARGAILHMSNIIRDDLSTARH